MGRIYFDDAPNPLEVDQAAVREGVAQAYDAVQVGQREAEQFMRESGGDASAHAPVGAPGRMGDPDLSRDAGDL